MPNERLRLHLTGQTIGSYFLIERIGAGGMAEVYLAKRYLEGDGVGNTDQVKYLAGSQCRQVAVKIVCPTNEIALESGITNIEERFIGEGIVLKSLDHPNILPVYESGSDRGYLYHVMEYVPNGSLADAICGRAEHPLKLPLPVPMTVEIIRQVGSALQYIHERGIVHRDVKPGNLLVRIDEQDTRQLLLADFGVACWRENASQREDQVTGTVAYMAPEVFNGWFSPASDQYSLAVMAFQLLTGHLPFEGTIDEEIGGHLRLIAPSVRMHVEDVPWQVEEVIARALEKRPIDRYATVAAFVEELELAHSEAETGEDAASLATEAAVHMASQATTPIHQSSQRHPSYRIRALLTLVTAILLFMAMLITLVALPGGFSRGGSSTNSVHAKERVGSSQHSQSSTVVISPTVGVAESPTISVPTAAPAISQTDSALLVALSAPSSVPVGHIFSFQLTLINTGTSTWAEEKGYHLICDLLRHPAQDCPDGFVATLGNYSVAPGREVTFQVWLTALASPGIYTAWINMAHSSTPFTTGDVLITVKTRQAHRGQPKATAPPVPGATPSITALPQPTSTPSTPAPTVTPPAPTVQPSPAATPTSTAVASPSASPTSSSSS